MKMGAEIHKKSAGNIGLLDISGLPQFRRLQQCGLLGKLPSDDKDDEVDNNQETVELF